MRKYKSAILVTVNWKPLLQLYSLETVIKKMCDWVLNLLNTSAFTLTSQSSTDSEMEIKYYFLLVQYFWTVWGKARYSFYSNSECFSNASRYDKQTNNIAWFIFVDLSTFVIFKLSMTSMVHRSARNCQHVFNPMSGISVDTWLPGTPLL